VVQRPGLDALYKAVFVLNLSKNSVLCNLQHKKFGFLKGMKIEYFAILNVSLNKAVLVLNLSKNSVL
jgi:hypothetical protein